MGHFHRSLSRGTQPSGPQFTEHLWSLLCRGLLSDTSCCTFHGGLPLPCISGSQTWSPVASFPVGLPQTLQLRFSGQVDWIHFLPLWPYYPSKSCCWLPLGSWIKVKFPALTFQSLLHTAANTVCFHVCVFSVLFSFFSSLLLVYTFLCLFFELGINSVVFPAFYFDLQRKSPGEVKIYPLQYSGLENSVDCIVHGVAKSWIRRSDFHS